MRVLQATGSSSPVARSSDTDSEALVLELRELAEKAGHSPSGPYSRLIAYDEARNASMVGTLQAWLDAQGDIIAASAASHVHQNTLRYRLKRIGEISEVDLDDPETRFALALQLRIFPPRLRRESPVGDGEALTVE